MSKKNKIIPIQIANHIDNIIEFHLKKNMSINDDYFQLLARHLTMRETP